MFFLTHPWHSRMLLRTVAFGQCRENFLQEFDFTEGQLRLGVSSLLPCVS